MVVYCAIKGCHNNAKLLKTWKNDWCHTCKVSRSDQACLCQPPFRLFPVPTKTSGHLRQKWKHLINRVDFHGKKLWSPSKDCRVCSKHFVDGRPTEDNPYPTLHLGYENAENRVKRILFQDTCNTKGNRCPKTKQAYWTVPADVPDPDVESLFYEPPQFIRVGYSALIAVLIFCRFLFMTVVNLVTKVKGLEEDLAKEKRTVAQLNCHIKHLSAKLDNKDLSSKLLNNRTVSFYTGINTKELFFKILHLVKPYIKRHWIGTVSLLGSIRHFTKKRQRRRHLSASDELLLTLMKLRLGHLTQDLAQRFEISTGLCSQIFFSWLRGLSLVLRNMIYIPDMEQVRASKPVRFQHLPDIHSIIDCTEIFIETPKDLYLQNVTWSQYKHHNTVKVLVAIAPNGTIIFVSKAYTGRMSDKEITLRSKYLELVPPYSQIMADKGFNIENECAQNLLSLHVPPGRRGQSQMTSACVLKTKRIANLRILVEQVIRELKTFRLLQQELPLSLVPLTDDIITVCSALVNFRKPMY